MKLRLLFLLIITTAVNAQNISFTDTNFKSVLLSSSPTNDVAKNAAGASFAIDSNTDGEIQVAEALLVKELKISGMLTISSTNGISFFTNLEKIYFTNVALNIVQLPNLQGLKYASFIGVVGVTNIVLSSSGIQELWIDSANYGTSSTATIHVGGTSIKKMSILNSKVNFSNQSSLATVENYYEEHSNTNTDFTLLTGLKILYITDLTVFHINLLNQHNLESLTVLSYPGTSAEVGINPKLEKLEFQSVNVQNLDLSQSPDLEWITLNFGTYGSVNLKNGSVATYMWFADATAQNVCVDEAELAAITGTFPTGLSSQDYSVYCSDTPGGNYNTISGTVKFADNAGACNTGNAVEGLKIKIQKGNTVAYTYTNAFGKYYYYGQAGMYTVSAELENSWAVPAPIQVDFTNAETAVTVQDICITPIALSSDLEVAIVPEEGAKPGIDAIYKISYKNKGSQTASGNITFTFDDTVLDFMSASPIQEINQPGILSWNYTNLLPLETRTVFVTLNVNGPMEIPAVNSGDWLHYTATITPQAGDATPADNTFLYNEEVVGSFDPNDITCLEGEFVSPAKIGDYLHYNIRFENTGTHAATFIVVKDVINTAQFDINTLEVLESSHPIITRVTGNKVEFRFDNILLQPLGQGNVAFKIKTRNTLVTGNSVAQQAEIFFDYNWPVVTNTATTTFQVLGRNDFETDNSVVVYPNPAHNQISIKSESEIQSVTLYDLQGRLLQTTHGSEVDISQRANGIYLARITTDKGTVTEKIIKQ